MEPLFKGSVTWCSFCKLLRRNDIAWTIAKTTN